MRIACSATFLIAIVLSCEVADAQSLRAGLQLAQTQCATCHQVGPGAREKAAVAPSFADIASTKGMTEISIEVFLSTPHGRMPNYVLSQSQIADVAAYIMSLRPAYTEHGRR